MVVTPNMLGLPIKRGEDPRLVSGTGAYLEDLVLPGLVHLVSARSPYGHARIGHIDVSAAREAPGVVLVLTGQSSSPRCTPSPTWAENTTSPHQASPG